ncbi:MAG: peptidase MA family metallohydrolase [Candidatus Omnitrophota bacterium]
MKKKFQFFTILIFVFFLSAGICFADHNDFKELRSEHFIIKYHSDVDTGYVNEIKSLSEDLYRKITEEFRLIRDKLWLWENRARVFIAKDSEDYLNRFSCPSWSGACVEYDSKIIYTYPHQNNFKSLFAHEMTHIIFREYVNSGRVPLWLDEAIASYIEDKYSDGRHKKRIPWLKRVITEDRYIIFSDLEVITGTDLRNVSSDYVNLFYIQSFSIINFLVEKYGNDNFSRFLFFLRRDHGVDEALAKGFHHSFRNRVNFEKQWKEFYTK